MNMAFSKTIEQVRNKTKRVTRRIHKKPIQIGAVYTAIEKGMGLKRGAHVVKICDFIPTDSRWEPLRRMIDEIEYGKREVILEGFPKMTPAEFVEMFCTMHHCPPETLVDRIEFKYMPCDLFKDGKHEFETMYNGIKCKYCDLFYPDNGNYFAEIDEEDDDEYHSERCTCETCIQNYPERSYLLEDVEEEDES
jgi:hypothetical protein